MKPVKSVLHLSVILLLSIGIATAAESKSADTNSVDASEKQPTPQMVIPKGWYFNTTKKGDYVVGLDSNEKHSGTNSAYIKSVVDDPQPFGNLMQNCSPKKYLGKRLRMSAWVKSDLGENSRTQLWIRIDGPWKKSSSKPGCFDNMDDRRIESKTEWTKYDLVVHVPKKSTNIAFGIFVIGTGQAWVDDISLEVVPDSTPLTGKYASKKEKEPLNLDFEDK